MRRGSLIRGKKNETETKKKSRSWRSRTNDPSLRGPRSGPARKMAFPERDRPSTSRLEKRVPENPWMFSVRGQGGNNNSGSGSDPLLSRQVPGNSLNA